MATPTFITLANANQASQSGSVTVYSGFTGTTTVSPGGSLPGAAFQTGPAQLYPGQLWRFAANGIYSSTGSPSVTIGINYGGSPLCAASIPAASVFTNAASLPWYLNSMGRVTQVGSAVGSWNVVGYLMGLQSAQGAGVTGTAGVVTSTPTMMPVYTSAAQYDTATAQLITLTMSASATGGSITVYNWAIEYLTEP